MEATKLFTTPTRFSSTTPFSHYSCQTNRNHKARGIVKARGGRNGGGDCWGDVVDSNMVVLRKRIKEIHMEEENYEPPTNWMEWEKKYYVKDYNEDVCEVMGLLQNYLMSVRPSLALGTLALVILSVLISSGMVLSHALVITKEIISGLF